MTKINDGRIHTETRKDRQGGKGREVGHKMGIRERRKKQGKEGGWNI
jgi:hypothetical protein